MSEENQNDFTEHRKDGWPLCPRCGDDELYSVFLMSMNAHIRQEKGEEIKMDEILRHPFGCYNCGWSNDGGVAINAEVKQVAPNLDDLQKTVGEWGAETFPRSNNSSIVNHLKEEVEELAESGDPSEAADCLLMLLHFAHRNGFSLFDEALKKHLYVREHYVFGEPDEKGISRHIKATEQP